MIDNWFKKKLTFVIIPDANRSVVRLRLSPLVLAATGAAIAALAASAVTIYMLQLETAMEKKRLQQELHGRAEQYDQTIAGKETVIQQLQNEIIDLSQQADDVKRKMDEMKKLENDLRSISFGDGKISSPLAAASGLPEAGTAQHTLEASGKGLGGALQPAGQEEILKLSAGTRAQFTALAGQMDELEHSMSSVKEDVMERQHLLAITPTIWPTDSRYITSGFGYRKDPFTAVPSFHSGYDIAAPLNSKVYSTADGVVVSTGYDSSHGNNIVIEHSPGLRTWYMHLNQILVKRGQALQKGDPIGLAGSTGRSTGSHVHYEVIENGRSVDPRPYLQSARKGEQHDVQIQKTGD